LCGSNRLLLGLFSLAALSVAGAADAEVRFKTNKSKTRIVEISGLATTPQCHPSALNGVVTERKFDGTALIGFVVEQGDGTRIFVNVDPISTDRVPMYNLQMVNQGLHQLTKVGKKVALRVNACGAAGRVLELDRIR
jgi:hypothetical protein